MGSRRAVATTALLLSLNLLSLTLVSSKLVAKCAPPPKAPEGTCPRDILKLEVCVVVLEGLLGLVVGTPPKDPCCSLLEGLTDVEAAVCVCTTIEASELGTSLDLPLSLSLLLGYCGKSVPSGFLCS
ncbi:14 kDa proline-rich protein DC2.15-like [Actinidia eriantha]|uniref:14 kDa proline-rich protein DC2.15-like n=1 Tax=Actinidia eriantha TaxID=165200 RepID=UPI002582C924|nr:14 kDa proline-rich protein DC2.15-like [Actinidia eriantha]